MIGGIVENAGYGCPLEAPPPDVSADQDGADMRSLVKAICCNGSIFRSVTFEEIVTTAKEEGLFEWLIPNGEDLDVKVKATFARLLKTYDRRLVGGHRFKLDGKGRHRRYEVHAVR
jgi:hypothetical protein